MLPWHMTEIKQVQAEVLKLQTKKIINKTKSFKMSINTIIAYQLGM